MSWSCQSVRIIHSIIGVVIIDITAFDLYYNSSIWYCQNISKGSIPFMWPRDWFGSWMSHGLNLSCGRVFKDIAVSHVFICIYLKHFMEGLQGPGVHYHCLFMIFLLVILKFSCWLFLIAMKVVTRAQIEKWELFS